MTYDERVRMADLVEVLQFAIRNVKSRPEIVIPKLEDILQELTSMAHPKVQAA